MKEIQIPFECPGCKEKLRMQVNTFTAEHKLFRENDSTYSEKWRLVLVYKDLKGYNEFTTWDRQYKPRSLKVAGKILRFFAMLEDPVGVAIECMVDVHNRSNRENWTWTLDTIVKRAPDWLSDKQKEKK